MRPRLTRGLARVSQPAFGMGLFFLGGDLMTGRGVDQVLPHPGDPRQDESHVTDARAYVALAEQAHGPIPRPVSFAQIWGDALGELETVRPDVRLVNLETSVTRSDDRWPRKPVTYRMSPANLPCLTAAGLDVCALANDHVLDYGRAGLIETLDVLAAAGIATAGAGRDAAGTSAPAIVPLAAGGRAVVFAWGSPSSGIPDEWAARGVRPGVALLDERDEAAAAEVERRVRLARRPGDVVIASIHWGGNWGFDVPDAQMRLAHRLIDAGVDVVHGHSPHHVKPLEVYRGRLVLHGCGDLLDDYEGIRGYEEFRGDLALLWFARTAATGELVELRMVPMQIRGLRLVRASGSDAGWLQRTAAGLGAEVRRASDGSLEHRAVV